MKLNSWKKNLNLKYNKNNISSYNYKSNYKMKLIK